MRRFERVRGGPRAMAAASTHAVSASSVSARGAFHHVGGAIQQCLDFRANDLGRNVHRLRRFMKGVSAPPRLTLLMAPLLLLIAPLLMSIALCVRIIFPQTERKYPSAKLQ